MASAGTSAAADVRLEILYSLSAASDDGITDSQAFAASKGVPHLTIVGATKSLEAKLMVVTAAHSREVLVLTEEALGYAASGSPEFQVFNAIPAEGGITGTTARGATRLSLSRAATDSNPGV